MHTKSLKITTYNTEITYGLLAACLVMALFYAVNVYSIVSRTIAMEKIEAEAAHASAAVQSLDAQYIALSNNITPAMVKQYGFREGSVSAYIPRTPSLGVAIGRATL